MQTKVNPKREIPVASVATGISVMRKMVLPKRVGRVRLLGDEFLALGDVDAFLVV